LCGASFIPLTMQLWFSSSETSTVSGVEKLKSTPATAV